MNHPSCHHPISFGDDYEGLVCCICDGRPCQDVTVDLMAHHRAWDIALWTEATRASA